MTPSLADAWERAWCTCAHHLNTAIPVELARLVLDTDVGSPAPPGGTGAAAVDGTGPPGRSMSRGYGE